MVLPSYPFINSSSMIDISYPDHARIVGNINQDSIVSDPYLVSIDLFLYRFNTATCFCSFAQFFYDPSSNNLWKFFKLSFCFWVISDFVLHKNFFSISFCDLKSEIGLLLDSSIWAFTPSFSSSSDSSSISLMPSTSFFNRRMFLLTCSSVTLFILITCSSHFNSFCRRACNLKLKNSPQHRPNRPPAPSACPPSRLKACRLAFLKELGRDEPSKTAM